MFSIIILIIIGIFLLIGAYTDYLYREIPNWLTISIFFLGFFSDSTSLPSRLLGFFGLVAILVLVSKATGKRSGGGDVKLYLSLVFALGWYLFSAVLLVTLIIRVIHVEISGQAGERFPLCCYVAPAYILVITVVRLLFQ